MLLEVGLCHHKLSSENCSYCSPKILCFRFHLFPCSFFFISSLISYLTYSPFSNVLFNLRVFVLFPDFFLWLISSFIALWSENMHGMTLIFLNLLRLVLLPNSAICLENVPCQDLWLSWQKLIGAEKWVPHLDRCALANFSRVPPCSPPLLSRFAVYTFELGTPPLPVPASPFTLRRGSQRSNGLLKLEELVREKGRARIFVSWDIACVLSATTCGLFLKNVLRHLRGSDG